MQTKQVIVTGGAGFLGRHLCRALAATGMSVRVVDFKENPEFPTTIADVRDRDAMLQIIRDADCVFHLASLIEAGESVKKPARFIDHNILGTLSVLDAMKENGVKTFIFSSSAAVYGEPLTIPIREDDRTIPINPYGMTKLAMEGLLSSYVQSFGLTGVALRYFNLYGPEEHHEPETHAIPRFIEQVSEGREVTVWGSGEHKRDYIFIADIVAAHLKALAYALKHPQKYHYFNLSTERPASVVEIVKLIGATIGKEPNIKHFPERPGDPLLLYADASKAREQLGWEAQVQLEDGLRETVAYFQKYWQET